MRLRVDFPKYSRMCSNRTIFGHNLSSLVGRSVDTVSLAGKAVNQVLHCRTQTHGQLVSAWHRVYSMTMTLATFGLSDIVGAALVILQTTASGGQNV